MAQTPAPTFAFNRGIVSKLALGRIDLERMAISAEVQRNFMPRSLGPMMLRPGLEFIAGTAGGSAELARYLPFVFGTSDVALLELTTLGLRVLVDDELVTTPETDTAIDDIPTIASWTDGDEEATESGLKLAPNTPSGEDEMYLWGNGYQYARRWQHTTVALADQGVRHALYVEVSVGPVDLRIGSTEGEAEYLEVKGLKTGAHWLGFTPTEEDLYIEFRNNSLQVARVVHAHLVEGEVAVATPWVTAENLDDIRYDQSADVVFVACDGVHPHRIERRGDDSWSVVKYEPRDGPFGNVNLTRVQLAVDQMFPGDVEAGRVILRASEPIFTSESVGQLVELTPGGQHYAGTFAGGDEWTPPLRVSGKGSQREIAITYTPAAFVGTVTLQASVAEPGNWFDVQAPVINPIVGNTTYNDGLDDQILYYRLGIKSGDYTGGSVFVEQRVDTTGTRTEEVPAGVSAGSILSRAADRLITTTRSVKFSQFVGTQRVVLRIIHVAPSPHTSCEAVVLNGFLGASGFTDDWRMGDWKGGKYPTAVCLHEGRLWWSGRNRYWGSISDNYENFDDAEDGDAGPISRSIGRGPVDKIAWMVPTSRLLVGAEGTEFSVRSSSIDEPLTRTSNAIKPSSTQGSAPVAAVVVDDEVLFVNRSGARLYALGPANSETGYGVQEMTLLAPEILEPSVVRLAVQRQPDTRVHCVRSDGKVAVFVYSKLENVRCWVTVELPEGYEVVDAVVLPGGLEDQVYYTVRTPSDEYCLVKWAQEREAIGGALNKQLDLAVIHSGAAVDTLTGFDHFPDGTELAVWADGAQRAGTLVLAGEVDLDAAYSDIVVGLAFDALFKSTKLSRTLPELFHRKKVNNIGLLLLNTHRNGITYGPDEDTQDPLPEVEDGEQVPANRVWEAYEKDVVEFDGEWTVDARVVLKAQAPLPCTVSAMVLEVETNRK